MSKLLSICELSLVLGESAESRALVRSVSLEVGEGEALGLVGESGSGKSLTARSVIRLLPNAISAHGQIVFDEQSVLDMSPNELRGLRSHGVSMIFQDPRAHINPIRKVGDFLTEGLRSTARLSRRDAYDRAVRQLTEVGIADASRRMNQFPHELSGGLLQRVMIASALLSNPKLILADEPTTALDVTTQEEVVAILDELRRDRGLAMLFISHDLDLTAAVCDRIAVMNSGEIVEELDAEHIYERASDPYTAQLLAARVPFEGADAAGTHREGDAE